MNPVAGVPSKWLLVTAFGIVYLVWGSTYLAIFLAIETLPPFLMAGVRFVVAGIELQRRGRSSNRIALCFRHARW